MRILIHDFAGHAFPVHLSRELARRGHVVTHAYPVGLPGPKGRLNRSADDPTTFNIEPILLSATFSKYSPVKRFISQRKYAHDLNSLIRREKPAVVLSGNTPIDVQAELLWRCRREGIGFVHWVQDVYCRAIQFFLREKLGALATLLSFPFEQLEKCVARRSDAAVVISPAFGDILLAWGVDKHRLKVLENWAPLDEMAHLPRNNAWSDSHGLNGKTVFLYSGTMGLKHRPDLLYKLAESVDDSCKVVVVTEGIGRAYLESRPSRHNLLLLDFQPYEKLPEVLASADVLVATLESEAGHFAVPSKILNYLCAGRPVLLSAPETNLAAEVIKRSGAGCVADPDSPTAWTDAALLLASDPKLRSVLGARARHYAKASFDISEIAIAFEQTFTAACKSRNPTFSPAENETVRV
jgi:colanic acid biosynthesis glycosyl transferase WcaI